MKFLWAGFVSFLTCLPIGTSIAQGTNIIKLSREAAVKITSQSGNSSGSGFFIGDQTVLTCLHVVAKISRQGQTASVTIDPDLQVVLPSGETLSAAVVSVPTQPDPRPAVNDFALVKLNSKPTKSFSKITLATDNETPEVGDEVVFSGYPLAAPGMITHRGMVSGFDDARSLIFIEASINKGNSGGALLNMRGNAIGIVCNREGGISKELSDLTAYIDQAATHGSVQIQGVNTLQATKALIQTLDTYISTGIGYAHAIKFARDYIAQNPDVLK
jgi:S1-C subfamily serine protease